MIKKVKFYNYHEDNKICEGVLEKDPMFAGGYKIKYKNMIVAINHIKILENGKQNRKKEKSYKIALLQKLKRKILQIK